MARTLFFAGFVGLVFGLAGLPLRSQSAPASATLNNPTQADPSKVVFLAGELSDDEVVVLSATLAASGHPGTLLLDSAKTTPYQKDFLRVFRPQQVIPVGSFPNGIADMEKRLGIKAAPALPWRLGEPVALWKLLFPVPSGSWSVLPSRANNCCRRPAWPASCTPRCT